MDVCQREDTDRLVCVLCVCDLFGMKPHDPELFAVIRPRRPLFDLYSTLFDRYSVVYSAEPKSEGD